MAKTYLGYGYTNENGVATLDFDENDNPLPKKSYQCHSRTASVVAEASVNNIVTSSENIRFCEGYVPPTESLTLTADKNILSYDDSDSCTLTATYDGTTLEGKSVVFKLGSRVLDTVTTDSEGVAECEYSSQGIGDVVFTAECGELVETIGIEDCFAYREIGSQAHNTGTTQHFYPLFDLTNIGDYEITGEISATTSKGFSVGFNKPTDWIDDNFARVMVDGAGYDGSYCKVNGNLQYDAYSTQYTANTYFAFKFKYLNGVLTLTHKNRDWTPQVPLEPCTFGFGGWNSNKTINYRNLKIKPLPFDGSMSVSASKDILSYADGDECVLTATLTGDNVANRPVVFKNGSTVLDTVNTDSNGVATYTYSSQGVGDVTFTVECMNLQETYEVHDYWKYIANGSYTGTSSISFQELYESSAYDNIEISATIKAPNKGFSLAFLKSKDSSSSIQDNIFTIGVDGGNYITVARIENGNSTVYTSNLFQQYTANSDLNCVIRIENGVVTLKLNNLSYTSTPITGLKYVGVRNWNNAKTVTYTDLKIKPL